MPVRRILITGAAGFAGSYLIERLGATHPIVGWFKPDTPPPRPMAGVEWVPVELVDRSAVEAAVAAAAPSEIYHLAGAPSVETSWINSVPHLQVNALGTHYLLRAVERARRRCRVLVVTSAQVYQTGGDPIREDAPLVPSSPYGLTKLAQDQLALQAASDGLDVVVARPFNHIGPRQTAGFAVANFARQVARIEAGLEPAVMRVGNLETRRDMTDVRDVADAYVRIMEAGLSGRPYNVCSGRAHRMRDLLERLRELAAVDITIETDPARLRPNDVPVVEGDATRLRSELGWVPHIDIDRTLRETLDWWRAEVQAGG
ncbi:MAG: GDP-mannose 4,6-dehydratase [Acidobacteriota bacterium]